MDRVGLFNPAFKYGQEDLEMWVRLSAKFNSAYIAEPLIKLRRHINSLTNRQNISCVEINHKNIINWFLNHPEMGPLFSNERNRIYASLYFFMADTAQTRQSFKIMRSYIFKSLKLYPPGIFSKTGLKWTLRLLLAAVPPAMYLAHMCKNWIQKISIPILNRYHDRY